MSLLLKLATTAKLPIGLLRPYISDGWIETTAENEKVETGLVSLPRLDFSMATLDLGWHNDERKQPVIDMARASCQALKHEVKDIDVGPQYRGMEHVVTCELCGYVYRYDSSD